MNTKNASYFFTDTNESDKLHIIIISTIQNWAKKGEKDYHLNCHNCMI